MTRNTSFYYSFLVLPRPEREAITAVFDVCRAIDDAVDLETEPSRAQAALDRWRREVRRIFAGELPETPQGRAMQPFVQRFHLPEAQFNALIDGVGMDAQPLRFRTYDELEPYCHRVASSVGLMCAEIFGYSDPAVLTYARDLGVALQLTNILRDVGVDYRRGRLYLPTEALAAAGASEADIAREVAHGGGGVQTEAVRAALRAHATLAREFFAKAVMALPQRDKRNFVAAEIMHAVYFRLLERIEQSGFDVFSEVQRVSRPEQAVLAMKVWWRSR